VMVTPASIQNVSPTSTFKLMVAEEE